MNRIIIALPAALLLLGAGAAQAASSGNGSATIESAGTGVAIALPLIAGGIALQHDDWTGVVQLGVETGLTVGTVYALKQFVREKRPDGSDWQSFPSDTTALAASSWPFLWERYGWEYGVPAFVATQFVAYSRVQAKQHHWYDTLASQAIAAGYGFIFTTHFHKYNNIYTDLTTTPDGAVLHVAYSW